MKKRSIVKILVWFLAAVVIVASILATYALAYRRGFLDSEIKRIPFDLALYSRMYNMYSYIISKENSIPEHEVPFSNPVMLLFTKLKFYHMYKERFGKIATPSPSFEENLAIAEEVVKDLETVSLESALQEAGLDVEWDPKSRSFRGVGATD